MHGCAKPLRIVVLGGTSRVWRAMAPHWRTLAGNDVETCVWARHAAPGVDVVCARESAANALPRCHVLLALWGVTSGAPADLAENTRLARAAQEIGAALGARAVLHAMTGAVYAPSSAPLSETAVPAPRHPYGQSKLAAECALAGTQPRPIILRLGNVAGTDGLADGVASARCKETPLLLDQFPDGSTPRRSYIAPDDLAGVLQLLARRAPDVPHAIFNVAGPLPVEMVDLVAQAGVSVTLRPAPPDALPLQHLDVQRLLALGLDVSRSADPAHLARFLSDPGNPA